MKFVRSRFIDESVSDASLEDTIFSGLNSELDIVWSGWLFNCSINLLICCCCSLFSFYSCYTFYLKLETVFASSAEFPAMFMLSFELNPLKSISESSIRWDC